MSFVKPSYAVDNVQQLADLTENQATLVKQTFDKTGSDTKDFLNAHMDELDATIYTKTEINNLDSDNVKLTGNQTIADVKTFLNSPVIPIAINGNNPVRKDTVDAKNVLQDADINTRAIDLTVVHKNGNESINDVKTFINSPIVPTPTTPMHASTKGYVDTHKSSGDHDGRYYTEAEINDLLQANKTGDHSGTWQGYSPTATDPGIQSVLDTHLSASTPHILFNAQNGKYYKYGYQINAIGQPQLIYEEVI